jgi:hypothetical protein
MEKGRQPTSERRKGQSSDGERKGTHDLGGEVAAEVVDAKVAVDAVVVEAVLVDVDACAVDEEIEPVLLARQLLEDGGRLGEVAEVDVPPLDEGIGLLGLDLGDGLVALLLSAVEHDNLGAGLGERARDLEAAVPRRDGEEGVGRVSKAGMACRGADEPTSSRRASRVLSRPAGGRRPGRFGLVRRRREDRGQGRRDGPARRSWGENGGERGDSHAEGASGDEGGPADERGRDADLGADERSEGRLHGAGCWCEREGCVCE